jgi:FkbM family methyltransferase
MPDLLKPEYLWRPSQILRRLSFRPCDELSLLTLPWHCSIKACSSEVIGRSIATQGVYDLPLTEAIVRLTDVGDTALDLGANIGYATLVLARSAGAKGRVFCFEPNPALLPTLRWNVTHWNSLRVAQIQIQTVALSDRDGDGVLGIPKDYSGNQGIASLELKENGVSVSVRRLDSLDIGSAAIMKVDVEGHEAAVFAGAEKLLARKLIRDILFEEHESYPAPSHKLLLEHGYSIFRLTRSTWRPLLLPPEARPRQAYLPSNYLATADPSRACARFAAWGWRALSAKPRQSEAQG